MLKLGESRDATAMFEAHHPFTNRLYLESVLSKYRIDANRADCTLLDSSDELSVFEWPATKAQDSTPVSEFALDLRKNVLELYLKPEAKRRNVSLLDAAKTTPTRRLVLLGLFCLFIATLPGFFRGEWWTVIAAPLANWFFIVNVFHDGSHFALSRDWRVNHLGTYTAWYFSSPLVWCVPSQLCLPTPQCVVDVGVRVYWRCIGAILALCRISPRVWIGCHL